MFDPFDFFYQYLKYCVCFVHGSLMCGTLDLNKNIKIKKSNDSKKYANMRPCKHWSCAYNFSLIFKSIKMKFSDLFFLSFPRIASCYVFFLFIYFSYRFYFIRLYYWFRCRWYKYIDKRLHSYMMGSLVPMWRMNCQEWNKKKQ